MSRPRPCVKGVRAVSARCSTRAGSVSQPRCVARRLQIPMPPPRFSFPAVRSPIATFGSRRAVRICGGRGARPPRHLRTRWPRFRSRSIRFPPRDATRWMWCSAARRAPWRNRPSITCPRRTRRGGGSFAPCRERRRYGRTISRPWLSSSVFASGIFSPRWRSGAGRDG